MGSSYISAATGAQMEELNNPDLRDCFQLERLADNDSDNSGFAFLSERVRQGHSDGDIFVSRSDQEIVGAVGPLRIMRDAANLLTRYPVYYGISKANRRQGRGSQLWDSALLWAKKNDVQYIALQARAGSPAEAFYKYIGITPIGAIKRHVTQLHT
ncbi:MAG: hypothetical protein C0508_29565 [Cyanobacteria bacterium PR.023]|nr:hypothetical protein [Cyanobacteria bacterium PR.023]